MLLPIKVRDLGQVSYLPTWQAMQRFTSERTEATLDEIWFCQHPPVFTQGLHGKPEHILNPHGIEVVAIDRGGQVTYHGPGQQVMYFLLDLKRLKQGPRHLVQAIEQSVIDTLSHCKVKSERWAEAPGIYVEGAKIASIGLRVFQGKTYHGLAFNVDMDLTPFSYINPCGMANLPVCDLKTFTDPIDYETIQTQLVQHFKKAFYE